MRIVFLGEDSFSAAVLETILNNGYEVSLIATPYYENLAYKRLELIAGKRDIPFYRVKEINSIEFGNIVKNTKPDLLVTAHFEKLLKSDLISIPRLGCINLHPSLLPKYRGMSPQHWPIIHGDNETGITIHFIEEGIDTGNILVQKKISIRDDIYVSDLQLEMIPVYKASMIEALKMIEEGHQGIKQDITQSSFYGRFRKTNAEITINTTKLEAYNLIRAISRPYMGAFFLNMRIWKASLLSEEEEKNILSQAQNIGFYSVDENNNYLVLKDGVLKIKKFDII